ncbi:MULTISPECIES: hypothetical protein [Bacillus cereus group]|uniref:hypothetical protein n=1 Tax=Bacillus cereus group TaxID=86661 RepID=UPI000BF9AAB6|nr:hypothetical protein [Bacillus cereus]PFR78325.1 hypothetical protein COK42_28715 [Bacillus cereus]
MNNELVVLSPDEIIDSGLSGFNEKDLPVMIQGQISKLKELDKSVKKAMKAADVAKDSANSARSKSAGFGKKKVAIEELQSAGIDLAEAVQSGAEAQKISFEFQTKLAEISKYLFGLGASNIASNRFVVRELEMKLKGASKEELSELARQELISVVKQLKEQEDILRKQENFSKIIKIHDERLKVQFQKSQQIDEQLKIHVETSKRLEEQLKAQVELGRLHSEQLEAHAEIGKKLKNQLDSQAEFDKLHEEQLKILAENIDKHDEQLVNLHEKNNDLNDEIKNNLKTIEAQEIKIKMLNDEIHNLKILLDSKGNKTLSKIILAVAIIAFIASVISYLFY